MDWRRPPQASDKWQAQGPGVVTLYPSTHPPKAGMTNKHAAAGLLTGGPLALLMTEGEKLKGLQVARRERRSAQMGPAVSKDCARCFWNNGGLNDDDVLFFS